MQTRTTVGVRILGEIKSNDRGNRGEVLSRLGQPQSGDPWILLTKSGYMDLFETREVYSTLN
jgi:hypothetical protein